MRYYCCWNHISNILNLFRPVYLKEMSHENVTGKEMLQIGVSCFAKSTAKYVNNIKKKLLGEHSFFYLVIWTSNCRQIENWCIASCQRTYLKCYSNALPLVIECRTTAVTYN
jgi:hypothetical protein